jgi:hypothetical protein
MKNIINPSITSLLFFSLNALADYGHATANEYAAPYPFQLECENNAAVSFIYNKDSSISLIDGKGSKGKVIDTYHLRTEDGYPDIKKVFSTKISGSNSIVVLVAWDIVNSLFYDIEYKVYAYSYDCNGNYIKNEKIDRDAGLSGEGPYRYSCSRENYIFNDQNAFYIEKYIRRKIEAPERQAQFQRAEKNK